MPGLRRVTLSIDYIDPISDAKCILTQHTFDSDAIRTNSVITVRLSNMRRLRMCLI